MVAEEEEEKRDIRRISTRAPSVLVSCLLFHQAFRSRPSAPRRLICQMGSHLHLQDASNLPFMPTTSPPTGQFVKMAASHPQQLAQQMTDCSSEGRLYVFL